MKYHEIGDEFLHEGVLLKVCTPSSVAPSICHKCYFEGTGCKGIECTEYEREDRTNVLFMRVDK